jgi:hypothetical protein
MFDRIDTTHFIPNNEYLKRCVEGAAVRRFLETSRYRKPVFVITGVKIVSGARGATTTSRAVDGMVGAQVDGTALSGGMAPVGGGPEIRYGKATKSAVSWEGSTDFVFAYKVSELRVSKAGEVKREREYTKGALYEDGARTYEVEPLAVNAVNSPSVESHDGFNAEIVDEGDGVITYGTPVPADED